MEIREITPELFDRIFPGGIAYCSGHFNMLNVSKAECVRPLVLFEDERPIAGQIFGLRGEEWRAPFSAPFSVLSGTRNLSPKIVDEFYRVALSHLGGRVKLVWPAPIYNVPAPPESENVIYDFNYHYPLELFRDYEKYLSRSGKYNHHRALKHNFDFYKTDDISRAYSIIDENRRAMGYPLAMTLDQVIETVKIINADFFILSHEEEDVAAAMLYHVEPGIMQLIYWGDLPHARSMRAMNHLAWRVYGWYSENRPDIHIIDIGPASTDGIKNEGLAQFKLSTGCVESLRPTIMLNIN